MAVTTTGLTPDGRFVELVVIPMDEESVHDAPIQVAKALALTPLVVREWAIRSYHQATSEMICELQRLWKCKRLPLPKDRLTASLSDYIRRSQQLLVQCGPECSQDVMRGMATILHEDIVSSLNRHAREAKEQQLQMRRVTKAQKQQQQRRSGV
jgi:hypothetical protein